LVRFHIIGKFSNFVENTGKKLAAAVQFVGIFVGIEKLKRSRRIPLFRTTESSRWPARTMARPPTQSRSACALTDVDRRAARPKRHGRRTARAFGARTKLMQHWADRIDHWLDPKKAMPIKGGAQA
jgi:hypothetical protein